MDMEGFIDDDFESAIGTRFSNSGARGTDGRWVAGVPVESSHSVNIQPLSDREAVNLGVAGERIQDFRNIYINDGDLYSISPQDEWEFDAVDLVGQRFKTYSMDNRPTRNYCKCVVSRNDR